MERKIERRMLRFSQKMTLVILIFSCFLPFLTVVLNFWLIWNGRPPMTQETITAMSTYGTITGSVGTVVYGILSGFRDGFKSPKKTGG